MELEKAGNATGLYNIGVEQNHTAINVMQYMRMHVGEIDPNWSLDEERLRKDFAATGLPVEWMEEFADTVNEQQYMNRLSVFQDRHRNDQMLLAGGWSGLGARVGSAFTDPATAAIEVMAAPLALAGKGSKLARFVRIALHGGAVGAAQGSLQSMVDPEYDWRGLLTDAAAGATFGTLFGAGTILRGGDEAMELQRGINAFADNLTKPEVDLSTVDSVRSAIVGDVDRAVALHRESLTALAGQVPDNKTRKAAKWAMRETEKSLKAARRAVETASAPETVAGSVRYRMLAEDLKQWGAEGATSKHVAKMRERAASQEAAPLKATVAELETTLKTLADQEASWGKADEALTALRRIERSVGKSRSLYERADLLPEAQRDELVKRIEDAERAERGVLKSAAHMVEAQAYEGSATTMYRRATKEAFAADDAGAARATGTRTDEGLDLTFAEGGMPEARSAVDAAVDDGAGDVLDSFQSSVRMDSARYINSQSTAEGRALGRLLHSSSVGVKGNVTNQTGIVERAGRFARVFNNKWMPGFTKHYKAWAEREGYSKLLSNLRPDLRLEFNQRVSRYLSGFDELDPDVIAAATAVGRQTMGEVLAELKKVGVKGADAIDPSVHERGYLPRRFRDDLMATLNERLRSVPEANLLIKDMFADALREGFRKLGREADEGVTARVAEHMSKVAFGRAYPPGVRYQGEVKMDYLDEVLREAGLSADEADNVLFKLTGEQDASGVPTNRFKHRLPMDLTVKRTLPDGSTLHLYDLYEDNAEALWDGYVREMAGQVSAAQAGFKDVRELERLIDSYKAEGKINDDGWKAYRSFFKAALGKPMEDNAYGSYARGARMVGDWNFLRVMGSVAWSMTAETGKMVGAVGLRATLQQLPALTGIIKDVLAGTADSAFARELAALAAPGTNIARSSVNLRPDDMNITGLKGHWMRKLDRTTQAAKRVQVMLSGLGPIQDVQQRMFSNMFLQHIANKAKGGGIDNALHKRLLDYGMSKRQVAAFVEHLKTNAVYDKGGVLQSLNVDSMTPELFDATGNLISRSSRHIIQELDAGHLPLWAHTTNGRLLLQFRSFTVGAYTRAFLHGMAMQDRYAVAMFVTGFAGAAMGYVGRTQANYAHDPEKRKKMLEPEVIARNAFAMTAEGGIVAPIVDQVREAMSRDPWFTHARGSGLGSSAVSGIPTVALFDDLKRVSKIPARAIADDREVTEEDLKAAVGLVYLNRLPGLLTGINMAVDKADLPKERESINHRRQ